MQRDPGIKLTPVMQQYLEIKRDHEDAILFFRLGDFYEMFFEDAERAAGVLDITLTSRNRNAPNPIPLCGVPYHSARPYIAKLINAGLKVAICEQVELPSGTQKIASRRVTKVVTPGTAVDEESLDSDRSRYLAAAVCRQGCWGLAWTDFSTGEVSAAQPGTAQAMAEQLAALSPSELIVPPGDLDALRACVPAGLDIIQPVEHGDGVDPRLGSTPAAASALSLLDGYVERVQGEFRGHMREPELHDEGRYLHLDAATRTNLEVVQTRGGEKRGSLFGVLDAAVSPMGRRLTRRWLMQPLARADTIGRRLDAVEYFVEHLRRRSALRETLRGIGDLERLTGRVGSGTAGPRDLVGLAEALSRVADVRGVLAGPVGTGETEPAAEIAAALQALDPLPEIADLIRRSLVDEPPTHTRHGGVIRRDYDEAVDRVRAVADAGKGWIAAVEADERKRTGVATLKVGYNKVFGYYIEISKAHQARVPDDYERKQTLTNAERYVTPALKEKEGEVLGAQDRLVSLEAALFEKVAKTVACEQARLARTAGALAVLDALAGLAETAHRRGYVRPAIHTDGALEIEDGRHPVVEAAIGKGFVANDCALGGDGTTLVVITGPNMAGKSTYLRQTALIALMAHAGSFVPASRARIPVMDRVFTRIGASDDLAAGRSTFMVEMSETADILANMSDRSLVVLDEIGRGTSTYDGISIAWAVAEALVKARVRTLFATHYHELAALAEEHGAVANFSVAVKRYKGEIVFLYRVLAGAASGSYGIDVAKLAGLPPAVIARASLMLQELQAGGRCLDDAGGQLGLFIGNAGGSEASVGTGKTAENAAEREVLDTLGQARPDAMTPLEALNLLSGLVRRVRNER